MTWELAGKYPEDPERPDRRRSSTRRVRRRAGRMLRPHHQRTLDQRARRVRFLARTTIGQRRHRSVRQCRIVERRSQRCTICANNRRRARQVRTSRSPTSSLRRRTSTTSAHLPSMPGLRIEQVVAKFEAANDDYSAIMLKALADRLAEAFAERLHERVRKEYWGYGRDEAMSTEELIAERYRGIRPAPGYPACPDHTEKATLFSLLEPQRAQHVADRTLRDVAGGGGRRLVLFASGCAILRRGQNRSRPGRRLCAPQRRIDRKRRALAHGPTSPIRRARDQT